MYREHLQCDGFAGAKFIIQFDFKRCKHGLVRTNLQPPHTEYGLLFCRTDAEILEIVYHQITMRVL